MDKRIDELLTVKEFAKAAGVTEQAIYKRLKLNKRNNDELLNYLTVVDGKKLIDKSAVCLFTKQVVQPLSEVKQLNQLTEQLNRAENRIDELLKQNSTLQAIQAGMMQKQLQDSEREKEKDTTIEGQRAELEEKTKTIEGQRAELDGLRAELKEKDTTIEGQRAELEDKAKIVEELREKDATIEELRQELDGLRASAANPSDKPKRRGFWDWITGKRDKTE